MANKGAESAGCGPMKTGYRTMIDLSASLPELGPIG